MLTEEKKKRLILNWGEKALNLACKAEVRLYDSLSNWQCFILAMNPDDENEIICIVDGFTVEVEPNWTLSSLLSLYNQNGEGLQIDEDFVPKNAKEIYDKLSRG